MATQTTAKKVIKILTLFLPEKETMLASKTWKRSEVPAKRYSPSYNSSTNSSLPKLLLKHNELIQKNIYILYLFQISEIARPKDIYVLFSGLFYQCDSKNFRTFF